jgi:hypothetical protein
MHAHPHKPADDCHSLGQAAADHISQQIMHTTHPTAVVGCHLPCTAPSADIQPGQGLLYEALTKTWRAQNCIKNNFGLATITYGLTPAPCRDCPNNMVATTDSAFPSSSKYFTRNADGTGGFISPFACVTTAGESGIVAFVQFVRSSGWEGELPASVRHFEALLGGWLLIGVLGSGLVLLQASGLGHVCVQ